MNFSDLLDEDGQGTRELDAWLAENIENEPTEWIDAPLQEGELLGYSEYSTEHHIEDVEFYTTGDLIDPIWELMKDYLYEFSLGTHYYPNHRNFFLNYAHKYGDELETTKTYKNEQLAIAEALFKAYQKEEE